MEGKKRDNNTLRSYEDIMSSGQPALEKVKEAFSLITDFYIADGEREIELLRAMNDRENLVKAQIKVSTLRTAQAILAEAYRQATAAAGQVKRIADKEGI